VIECKCGKRLTLKRAYLIEAEPDYEGGLVTLLASLGELKLAQRCFRS
jgi:hypothetical protein